MSKIRTRRTIFATLSVIGVALFLFSMVEGKASMPKIEVTFIVSHDLARKGGIVFVLPNKIDKDEFLHRYPAAGSEPMFLAIELSDPVSFVHFDAPGRNYSYRFQRFESSTPLDERQISVGGAGTIHLDENGDPVFAELSLRHYIYGVDISLTDAWGLEYALGDFYIGPDDCRRLGGAKVCVPPPGQIRSALEQLRKKTP